MVQVNRFALVVVTAAAMFLSIALAPHSEAEEKPTSAPRFTEHLLQGNYGYAYGIGVGDLDGDGRPEVTSADADRGDLLWFANKGMGRFSRNAIKEKELGWFERHVLGDVNGDGKPDVVVVKNLHGHVVWFENPGATAIAHPWPRHVITTKFMRAYDVALADLDGDGKPDVAASGWAGNRFGWFANPGAKGGEWPRHELEENIREPRAIHAVDLNRDGRPDLFGTARVANLVIWYENPGPPYTQKWKRHIIDDRSIFPTHGHPIDMDGDGDPDIVLALGFTGAPAGKDTNQVVWYENVGKPGKGTEWRKHVIGELDTAFEAVAADLNGDGKPDVAATAWGPKGQVVWFENPGDPKGKWKKHVLKKDWVRANQVIIADLDGDGRPDIIAAAERGTNEVRWWRNEGVGK